MVRNTSNYSIGEKSHDTHILNIETDIFATFSSNLIQYMNDILIIGSDYERLVVTFDAKSFQKGKYFA